MSTSPLKAGERAFNILLLLLSISILVVAYRISGFESVRSPGAFPMFLGCLLVLSMVVIIIGQRHHPRPKTTGHLGETRQFFRTHLPPRFMVFTLMTIGYLLLLTPLGFVPATLLFMFCAIVYLFRGRWVLSALVTVGATAIIYALFTLLFQVYLP
ncbi:tripartite tricarboxylate transporter TctB family protein [Larsenimonas rhizosphaerae]|uniref:tripartite tricarboxylate transporter TctB family protein n=1 Tax=Larsenimonas rhizosphaerae TaxID=2944682 RepID=UPI00203459B4|nr:tripartite tricarboxylate transporter TctB family protein [Larsenimonas rhizosphaerae]MCM2131517.1 tripartite tricarboxylate transporter TctB family protein [Larsenimonas rhizosphaerae]